MSGMAGTASNVPWWKEPTRDQWYAYVAAWLGWTLDAFDFTIFLLIMLPISQDFGVPLTAVTAVFAVTLWLRLLGATAAGWLADRWGRKTPLMISILWYSVCNLLAGFSPSFAFLFLFRAFARHRNGSGMAGWRGARHGILAAALAGPDVGGAARVLGPRLCALGRGLWVPLHAARSHGQGLRLARHADPRRVAGAGLCLDPLLREGARSLGRKPGDPGPDQSRK